MTPVEDPSRQSVFDDLSRAALETYGEERRAEALLEMALTAAATAVWRVMQEPLDPSGLAPLPAHE